MTKQNGVDVWPNAAIWMRDELRSKVRYSANRLCSHKCEIKLGVISERIFCNTRACNDIIDLIVYVLRMVGANGYISAFPL